MVILPPSSYSTKPPKRLPSPYLKDVTSSLLSSQSSTTSSTAPPKKLPSTNLKDVAKIYPSSPLSSPSSTTSSTAPLLGRSPQLSAPKMNKKPSKMRNWLRKIHVSKILKGFNGIMTITPTDANRGCNLPPIAPHAYPVYIP